MDKLYKKKLEKIFNQIDKLASKGKDNLDEYKKYIDELINKGDYSAFQECLQIFYKIEIVDIQDVQTVKNKTWNDIILQTNTPFLKKLDKLYKKRGVYQQSFNIYTTNSLQIELSNKLSASYSITGITPSISFDLNGDIIDINIYDSNINNIQMFRSVWVDDIPTNLEVIQSIMTTQSSYKTDIPNTHTREYLITTHQTQPSYSVYNYRLSLSIDPLIGTITEIDDFNPDTKYLVKNKQFSKIMGERVSYLEVRKKGDTDSYIVDTEEDFSLSPDQNLLNRYNLALDILLS